MEDENAWHFIEGAIKSLSSQLQSFPDDVKEKALKLLGTQLNNSSELSNTLGNSSCFTLKEESEDKNEIDFLSLPLVKEDCSIDDVSTSSLPKRSRRRRRGAQEQEIKTEESTSFEVKTTCAKKELQSGLRRRSSCAEEPESLKRVTRASGRDSKRKQKDACQSVLTETVKKTTRQTHKVKSDVLAADSKENVNVLTILPSTKLENCSEDNQEELSGNFIPDSTASNLKGRRRGRPRKIETPSLDIKPDVCSAEDSGVCEVKLIETPKKPGRPRQSSYSSGYVPKTKNFQCKECGKLLATRQSYKEHQRQHTGEGFICDNCGQKFTTSSGFMLHKRYHSDDPHMYKCSKCKYVVSSQQLLDDHFQLRHDPNRPKSHICDVCGKAFHGSTQLEKHLFSHSNTKPYSCDQCSFSTAYPGGLEKHRYNVHVADKALFRCELCGILLKSKGTYIEHIGRHFNQRKKKCETCDKTFPNASQLAAHRRCHLEPTVPCGICGKKLRSKHKLKVHELIHSGQKDFKCPCCSYVTYVKHNLKKHCMARHKMDYPPLITQKMKKFKLGDVSSDGLKDPLTLKCLSKLNSSVAEEPTEGGLEDGSAAAIAAPTLPTSSGSLHVEENSASVFVEEKPVNASKLEYLPMTKVEMIAANDPKTFMTDDKMYLALSTIDHNAIIDFHSGAYYPTNLYVPALVTNDQQIT